MDMASKEQVAKYRDSSAPAIARRLRAARMSVEPSQKAFAKMLGLATTTYNSQEVKGAPRMEVLDFLYLRHRISPNFILFGEVYNLPSDVQDRLIAALLAAD